MVSNRRAVSACYYALFHCLARECADRLIGTTSALRSDGAWRQVYRALDHGYAKKQCEAALKRGFPPGIIDFADAFSMLQLERHKADYDPGETFAKSTVQARIEQAEGAIQRFSAASQKDRRAFCVWVLLKNRPS